MENKEVNKDMGAELSCPCDPRCPNYGKCRECIAAHAKFYTVPHCIKTMQMEMKKNHLHPSNPHVKKTLPERVAEFYKSNPDAHLRTVAEELKIADWQLLDAMDSAVAVPVADFGDIYDKLSTLDQVLLHVDTGSVVVQLTTSLPTAMNRMGTMIVSEKSGDMSLTSLLMTQSFYSVFLVREVLCGGKESLSIAIVGEDEKIALSIYLRRTADNTIEKRSKELFEALWEKYNQ
jgi:putative heme iron utilization protein